MLEKYPYITTLLRIQLQRLKKDKRIIVDIGSFDGKNCISLAKLIGNSFTYAIEPCARAVFELKRNIRKMKNIKIHRLSITGENGEGKLFTIPGTSHNPIISQSNSMHSDFISSKNSISGKIEIVPTLTLNSFCRREGIEEISFLRLNCEGSEYEIFEDKSSRHLLKTTKVMYLALHGKSDKFISQKYQRKKLFINWFLKRNGFRLIYGDDVTTLKKFPLGHVNQVWIKV